MATIKTGAVVAEIRGSLGGNVFSRNKGGAYVRQRVKPINPNSPRQAAVRGTFGTLQSAWRALTQAEQNTWVAAAENYLTTNKVGDTVKYTPLQLFTRCNMTLLEAGIGQINTINPSPFTGEPMSLKGKPHPWDVLSELIDSGTLDFDVPNGSLPGGLRLRVYASGLVSPGVNSERSVSMRLIGYYEAGDVTVTGTDGSLDVLADWKAVYGDPTVSAGSNKIFARADIFGDTRGFGKPIGVQPIILEDGV